VIASYTRKRWWWREERRERGRTHLVGGGAEEVPWGPPNYPLLPHPLYVIITFIERVFPVEKWRLVAEGENVSGFCWGSPQWTLLKTKPVLSGPSPSRQSIWAREKRRKSLQSIHVNDTQKEGGGGSCDHSLLVCLSWYSFTYSMDISRTEQTHYTVICVIFM